MILLTILTHHDLPRLERAIKSSKQQYRSQIQVETLVVVNTLKKDYEDKALDACARLEVDAIVTESDGKPGRGKNACLDAFLKSNAQYLCQLDGDDFLYPTWGISISEHLRRIPGLDVLGICPVDCIGSSEGYTWTLPDGVTSAGVWGTSKVAPFGSLVGPRRSALWDVALPSSPDMVRLLSRKGAKNNQYQTRLSVGEDHLMSLVLLAKYIQGDLNYWLTMASDMMVIDRTTPNSVQQQYPQGPEVELLRELALEVVQPDRSAHTELPVLYPELLMSPEEKKEFINEHFIGEQNDEREIQRDIQNSQHESRQSRGARDSGHDDERRHPILQSSRGGQGIQPNLSGAS